MLRSKQWRVHTGIHIVVITVYAVINCFVILAATDAQKHESSVIALNKDNFDMLTKGKTVFIKFYAPWCDHCKKLAPEWEKMAAEWQNHHQGLVAEVDCSDHINEDWCSDDIEILGLPTIMYGDASYGGIFLEQWSGERTYSELSQFANETLGKPACSPGSLKGCQDNVRRQLESFWALSIPSLDERIESSEKDISDAEKQFKQSFDSMQKSYDTKAQDNEATVARIKYNLKLLKAVKEFVSN